MSAPCAACGFAKTRAFYTVENVPTQSNLLVASREAAVNFPRADVALSMCERCGFIFNTRFDPSLLESSERYEATQGFSATFGDYADELAARWVEQFDLRGKAVLEIGCGDGEFLERMVAAGAGRAIGFDPAAKPQAAGRAGVEIHREFYGEDSPGLDALGVDFLICRHTLEHVAGVAAFLKMLRRKIGGRETVRFGIEVPDAGRVVRDRVFWDVYYEHCSYFTEWSLESALVTAGFQPLEMRQTYAMQYLVTTAAPAAAADPGPWEWLPDVNGFAADVGRSVDHWRNALNGSAGTGRGVKVGDWDVADIIGRGGRVALWGAGSKAAGFLNTLGLRGEVACVVDVNPLKAGSFIPGTGQPVVLPEALPKFAPEVVIVMNEIYEREIERELKRLGIRCLIETL